MEMERFNSGFFETKMKSICVCASPGSVQLMFFPLQLSVFALSSLIDPLTASLDLGHVTTALVMSRLPMR